MPTSETFTSVIVNNGCIFTIEPMDEMTVREAARIMSRVRNEARMRKLSPERRSEIAKIANKASQIKRAENKREADRIAAELSAQRKAARKRAKDT